MERRWVAVAALLLLIAVGLGAFGAHGLSGRISDADLGRWHTAVQYQFFHALGMLLVALGPGGMPVRSARSIGWLFLGGAVAFSGSLYLLSTRDITGWHGIGPILGPITPLGGLCFMAGWGLLLITALRRTNDR